MNHRLFLSLSLAACAGGTSTPTPTATDPAFDCSTLALTACDAEVACSTVVGAEIAPGREGIDSCLLDWMDLACQSAGRACDDVITHAAEPSAVSTCYEFPDSCIPEGWVACDPDPGATVGPCL